MEQYIEENKIKDDEFHEHLRKAKLLLKRSNRKDLYATLNLPQGSKATEEDIRKAYKKSGKDSFVKNLLCISENLNT